MKKRLVGLFATGVLVLGLVGCGSDDKISAEEAETLKLMKEMAESENITKGYLMSVNAYLEVMKEFHKATYNTVKSPHINDISEDELIELTNEFILFSDGFETAPISKADKVLHEEFLEFKYDNDAISDYILEYVYKGDDVYRKLYLDSFDDMGIHLDRMNVITEKYGIEE